MPVVFLLVLIWGLSMHDGEANSKPVILAFGDSLTAGYMVPENESYPERLQKLLKEKGYSHKVINAGVTGDTTAGGVRRINWLLKHKPEIVILELGANDGLRGLPIEEMRKNLSKIIESCLDSGAQVLLAGMKIPPNYGLEYTNEFEKSFSILAKKYNLPFIPFFLEDVAAHRELTQPDGIHPVGKGYNHVTHTVWKHLQPMLEN